MIAGSRRFSRRAFIGGTSALALAPLLVGCRNGTIAPTTTLRVHLRLSAYERAFFEQTLLPAYARDRNLTITLEGGTTDEAIGRLGDPLARIDLLAIDTERLGGLVAEGAVQAIEEQRAALAEPLWRGMLVALESSGKLYALPYRPTTWIGFYNRAILDAAKLAPPPTWDALLGAANRLSEAGAAARVALQGAAGEPAARTLVELIWAFGGDPLALSDAGSQAAGEFLARLGPRLAPLSREASFASMTRALGAGEVALGPNWPVVASDLLQRGGQPQIAAYAGPAGARLLSGQVLVMPRYAANAEKALAFATYLRDPATQATLAGELAWLPAGESALGAVPKWQRDVAVIAQAALRDARALPPLAQRPLFDEALGTAFRAIAFEGVSAGAALRRAAEGIKGVR